MNLKAPRTQNSNSLSLCFSREVPNDAGSVVVWQLSNMSLAIAHATRFEERWQAVVYHVITLFLGVSLGRVKHFSIIVKTYEWLQRLCRQVSWDFNILDWKISQDENVTELKCCSVLKGEMNFSEGNSSSRENQETHTGNICTCNFPLKTSIYCEQAFRDGLTWQLVGLSANYSLLSHLNVCQCISFLAIVQLVRKKKSIEHLLSRIHWFKIKMLCGDGSDSVQAINRGFLPGPPGSMKGDVAAPLP